MTVHGSPEATSPQGLVVAAIQHDIVRDSREATLHRLEPLIRQAAARGAHVAVLSEMFAIGFSARTQELAEELTGPTTAWMRKMARAHRITLAGSAPLEALGTDRSGSVLDRPTNSLLVVEPEGRVHRYDKIHLFSHMGENDRFSPGDSSAIIDIHGVRIGLSVCYDLRFANLYWDRAHQVDLELVVANWPAARARHWSSLLRARAIENQVYVLGVNRVGRAGSVDHSGGSALISPTGDDVALAADGAEAVIVGHIDPHVVVQSREHFPVLADRRRVSR